MPIFAKTLLLSVIYIVSLAGSTGAQSQLVGDLNKDYKVNFNDLRTFSWQWLDPGCLAPGCIADLDGVDGVNMADFALLAKNWQIVDPHIIISEFMARNASQVPLEEGDLLDGNGDSSDWIEIYNPTDTTVNLDGWYLTDSKANLTMWQFPDGNQIKPGEFLVVFASGKTYEENPLNYPYLDPGGDYHTNFELDQTGDYLALVAPDGNTVIHEYAPEFPIQLADISYGLAQYGTTLVPTGATASYYVPTISDAAMGTDWTDVNFDDSAWKTGQTGVGFGYSSGVAYEYFEGTWDYLPDFDGLTPVAEGTVDNFDITQRNQEEYFGFRFTALIGVPANGTYTFYTTSDDGSQLFIEDNLVVDNDGLHSMVESSGSIYLDAGRHPITVTFFEKTGGEGLIVSYEGPGISKSVVSDDVLWCRGVTTDVQEDMLGVNASLWTRIEFYIEEGENSLLDTMKLRMKYEDGFVAYLNGQEVARRNAPNPVEWNSTADSNRPIEDSSIFEEINLMAYLYLLQSGKNVLAIHGLNHNENDSDFLILPELVVARNQSVPQYFTTATPGTFNIPGAIGRVGEVWFSHKRGFYEGPPGWHFDLALSNGTEGAEIRYTDDGSLPTITHGLTYNPATGPPIEIDKTTTIRAVAVKPGWLDSAVDTHTYIFLDKVIYQSGNPLGFPSSWGGTAADYEMDPEVVNVYLGTIKSDLKSIPTMSLVTDVDDMFGTSGIYSNPSGTGFTWERPGSVELIYPNGSEGFQVDCGVRIYGGAFRDNWSLTRKKTFRLLFKGIYGPTKLRYPLFGEDAADEFDTIILRGGANDAWNGWGKENTQYIVDEFMRRTQLALGHPSGHGTFVHLYVNGLYWGLYNPVERPQSSFAANYFEGPKEEWDTNNSGNPCGESSMATWNAMFNLVGQGLTSTENYQRIQGNNPDGTNNPAYDDLLDVDNYIGYMFSNFWGGTGDWPHHNYYAGCRRPPNATGFKFFNWDSEGAIIIWSSLTANVTGVSGGAGGPYAALRQNSEFCLLFADHAHRYMLNNGPATSGPSYARYKELADEVERAIVGESARWGDMASTTPYTLSHWQTKRDYILNTYMPQRRDIVFDQLRNAGLYPANTDAPVFYINGAPLHGGDITTDDELTMDNPNGSGTIIYYTTDGNDVRLPEELQMTGTTLLAEGAPKKVLVPTGPVNDNWKGGSAFDDSGWNHGTFISGKTGGVGYEQGAGYAPYISYDVTAKMYNGNNSCYIRIPFTFNGDPCDFNFMMLYIRYDDGFIAHLNGDEIERINFPENDTPLWNSGSSGQHEASGLEAIPVSDHLDSLKNGDNILAIQGLNISNTSSDFIISAKLVAGEANSTGGISPSATEYTGTPLTFDKSTHVKTRVLDGITWSALNEAVYAIGPVADYLRITEIMYHPQNTGDPNDPNTEFVELKNIGPDTVNLNLVRFTEGIDFTFPDIELDPDECVVVTRDQSAFEAKYGTSINIAGSYTGSLANDGERIKL
ncbi:MAG: lamin tail domain-containing protein, partial [Sedimentisphaerales bacterium]